MLVAAVQMRAKKQSRNRRHGSSCAVEVLCLTRRGPCVADPVVWSPLSCWACRLPKNVRTLRELGGPFYMHYMRISRG